MTTVASANVRNIAIHGSFDDCQDLVKAMFADASFRDEMRLAAVNSINWGRIMAQIVYYVAAALALGAPRRRIAFAVPTGNFGNVYAGYAARAMGLPVEKLIVGSNRNDILTRFIASGRMEIGQVHPTLSPSMDIQVSSNAERLLFDLYGRDGRRLAAAMKALRETGKLGLDPAQHRQLRALFAGHKLDDQETLAAMAGLDGGRPRSAAALSSIRSSSSTKLRTVDPVERLDHTEPPPPRKISGTKIPDFARQLRAVQGRNAPCSSRSVLNPLRAPESKDGHRH